MAVISTGLLRSVLRGEFLKKFDTDGKLTHFLRWATRLASKGDTENYRWLGSVPQMREWGTGRLARGLNVESYDVRNLKYESTLEVDRDEISDDQLGHIRIRVNELARRAATHKDYLIGQLLINGASSGFNSYDGVTFFNDAHVSGASGSQDNKLTAAIADKDAVTTVEFKAAFRAAFAAMQTFVDDQGEPMVLDSQGLVIVVPAAMQFAAREAMNAAIISSTSNVDAGMAEVVSFPYLTDTDTWYLLKVNEAIRPLIFQDREPIEFAALEKGSEQEFLREKYLYGVRARYRMTYGYWQYAIRYVFTTT